MYNVNIYCNLLYALEVWDCLKFIWKRRFQQLRLSCQKSILDRTAINGKKYSEIRAFLDSNLEVYNQSFYLGLANDLHICKKNMKNLQNTSLLFDPRINTISYLRGQSQCSRIIIRLTTWSSKIPKQFDLLWNTWKNCEFFL